VTSCNARTPGKDFEMPVRDRTGAVFSRVYSAEVAKVTRTTMD